MTASAIAPRSRAPRRSRPGQPSPRHRPGEVDHLHPRVPGFEERLKAREREVNARLRHHIVVEGQVDLTVVERDRLPIGERDSSPVLICAAPIPDAEQGNGAEALRNSGVGLPSPLSNEERFSGIVDPAPLQTTTWHIDDHAGLARRLVLDDPPILSDARLIGPIIKYETPGKSRMVITRAGTQHCL